MIINNKNTLERLPPLVKVKKIGCIYEEMDVFVLGLSWKRNEDPSRCIEMGI